MFINKKLLSKNTQLDTKKILVIGKLEIYPAGRKKLMIKITIDISNIFFIHTYFNLDKLCYI